MDIVKSAPLSVHFKCTQRFGKEDVMQTINVRETREKLAHLLDAVESGEEIIILRNGEPAAKLTTPAPERVQFPDRSELRSSLPPCREMAAETVRSMREEERY